MFFSLFFSLFLFFVCLGSDSFPVCTASCGYYPQSNVGSFLRGVEKYLKLYLISLICISVLITSTNFKVASILEKSQ